VATTRDVEYTVDGATMIGRLAVPEGQGACPAVLIAHEGPGLDDVHRDRAERLADLGYVAFALDYHGGGERIDDRDAMMQRLGSLMADPEQTSTLAQAGLDVLLAEPRADASRAAAIGYCFGGTMVLELARSGADLAAIIGFHPGLVTTRPEASQNIRGVVLMCVGSEDALIPVQQRLAFEDEMRAAGVDWRINVYGAAEHSFTHPFADGAGIPGIKYDAAADARSWRAMLDTFDEVFT
jgi:dienelactone hydrolase